MAVPIPLLDSEKNPGQFLIEQYLALEATSPSPDALPPTLIVTLPPVWTNKYQILLYGAAARHRHTVVGVTKVEDLELVAWPGPVVLHAHWFAGMFRSATSEHEAMQILAQNCARILAFRERTGARLIWTAHNVFPHGNKFPETFKALRRWTLEHFDAIHVMDETHVPILEEAYEKKIERFFVVPHMTYGGTVLDSVDPVAARAWLRLPQDAFVFAYFGSLQAYKGLDKFLEAFDDCRRKSSKPMAAVIGGIPGDDDTSANLQSRWGLDQDVRLLPRKILDHEIQYLHRAADVMVLPYSETLNSGAALMAASFRMPFITPRGSGAEPLVRLGAITYDAGQANRLAETMSAVAEGKTFGEFNQEALDALAPAHVSRMFFEKLDTVLR